MSDHGVESCLVMCELQNAMDIRNRDWIELVKATLLRFDVSIQGAHDLIFADAEMRKLIAQRINRNEECRKLA